VLRPGNLNRSARPPLRQFPPSAPSSPRPTLKHLLARPPPRRKNARAQEVAADLLVRLINHAREVAQGKTSPGPFAGIARLNVVRKALSDAQSAKTTKLTKKK
jgi:hypothetical protein